MEVYPNFVQQYPYWEPTSKIATKEKYTLFYNKNNTVILNVAFLQRLVISKNSAAEYEPLIILLFNISTVSDKRQAVMKFSPSIILIFTEIASESAIRVRKYKEV